MNKTTRRRRNKTKKSVLEWLAIEDGKSSGRLSVFSLASFFPLFSFYFVMFYLEFLCFFFFYKNAHLTSIEISSVYLIIISRRGEKERIAENRLCKQRRK